MLDSNFLLLFIFISLVSFNYYFPCKPALAVIYKGLGLSGYFDLALCQSAFSDILQWLVPKCGFRSDQHYITVPYGDGLVQDLHLFPRTIPLYHNLLSSLSQPLLHNINSAVFRIKQPAHLSSRKYTADLLHHQIMIFIIQINVKQASGTIFTL